MKTTIQKCSWAKNGQHKWVSTGVVTDGGNTHSNWCMCGIVQIIRTANLENPINHYLKLVCLD